MIYLVKNPSGAEFEVTEKIYNRYKDNKEYSCRTIGRSNLKPLVSPYPVKDDKGAWYTLSNGERVQGKSQAEKAEKALNG